MRRILAFVALTAAMLLAVPHAGAVTHSPCAYHGAVAPYVLWVGDPGELAGAGSIGGCPWTATTEGVTITVALQHLEDGVWVTKIQQTYSRSWNRYTRFARQTGGTLQTPCLVGDWRTQITGGDGFEPTEWHADSVITAGDSGVCGSYGGGD